MKIYNYDLNGYYLSEGNARANPLEEGNFLLPANATFEEPLSPKVDNKIKWNGESWEYEIIEPEPEPTDEELLQEAKDSKII